MGNNNGAVCNSSISLNGSLEHYYNTKGEMVGFTELTQCGTPCESWMLVPGENLWNDGVRGFLYIIAMLWVFVGIAIASDIFMMSIEVITSGKRQVTIWDNEKQKTTTREVLIWNETVANLTLMALGSSAPEILIAFVEAASNLPADLEQAEIRDKEDGLGVFTIMGSASFNLLMITAVCVVAPKLPEVKKVSMFAVFFLTSIWSLWAYIWMLLVVTVITPGVVDIWEAIITLLFFPLMTITAYCQDNGWWCHKCKKTQSTVAADAESAIGQSHHGRQQNVRVIGHDNHGGMFHGPSKELQLIENEQKEQRRSQMNLNDVEEGSEFRHAAVKSMSGGRSSARERQAAAEKMNGHTNLTGEEDLLGKFTFAAGSYSVLESSGSLEVDVLFHRKISAEKTNGAVTHSNLSNGTTETTLSDIKGSVAIQWETREGTAKLNRDFKYSSGKLVFNPDEHRKTITIPIINDSQFEPDSDFYVILKNPEGESGLGDPSVTRVTIIDDDEPGEFSFSKQHYQAENKKAIAVIERTKGCDGTINIEYNTVDGTAKGAESLSDGDYVHTNGTLEFKHGETSKTLSLDCNDSKKAKNFVLIIKNTSPGARIGAHPAAVLSLTSEDNIGDRLADILDGEETEEPMTWGDQFREALTVSADDDEVPSCFDYTAHFVALPWKLLCALTPPKHWLGGSLAFIISLALIAFMSSLVEQLAFLLGCVIGLRTAVCGISFVALGTSVPDTFASKTAATQDQYADAAIGNITGSNSVNVFLGLGLPWVLQSIYYAAHLKREFRVRSENLTQSVLLFLIVGIACLFILFIRRRAIGGELGGSKIGAYITAAILVGLWILFIVVISLIVYEVIIWDLPVAV